MVLIQLLLPAVPSPAATEQLSPLAETRAELAARFTGLTAYVRSPGKGLWTSPDGRTESDDVVMVEVVTDTFDHDWWKAYTSILKRRFQQDAIHVRALRIEMLDETAS